MSPGLQDWVMNYCMRYLYVTYSPNKKSKPHISGGMIFVGSDWLKRKAWKDSKLKRLLVLEDL